MPRGHIAAFDTATGALLTSFAPRTDGQVRGFAFVGNTVYAGGNFRSSNGQARTMLAAYDAAPAAHCCRGTPSADGNGYVWDMLASPDGSRIIVAGSITQLNGQPAYGMGVARRHHRRHACRGRRPNRIKSAGANGAISSLSTDGVQVYGTGYAFGAGASFEGTFAADPYTGNINWLNDCLGDTYSASRQGQVLYSVGHHHDCSVVGSFPDTNPRSRWQKAVAEPTFPVGTITKKDAYGWDFTGLPYAGQLQWYPDLDFGTYTSAKQAAWSVTGNSDYIVLGGEFPKVNDVAQQGLVRFAKRSVSPHAMGPINSTGVHARRPTPTRSGVVRVPFGSVVGPRRHHDHLRRLPADLGQPRSTRCDLHPQRQQLLEAAQPERHRHGADARQPGALPGPGEGSRRQRPVERLVAVRHRLRDADLDAIAPRCGPAAPPTTGGSTSRPAPPSCTTTSATHRARRPA